MYLVYLLFTIVVNIVKIRSCSESVVENDNAYTFHTNFKYNIAIDMEYALGLRWLHNNQLVSTCVRDKCDDDYPENTQTSLKYDKESHIVECNITVFNKTKECSGEWSLKYMGMAYIENNNELFKCNLPIVHETDKTTDTSSLMLENYQMKDSPDTVMVPIVIGAAISTILVTIAIVVCIAVMRKNAVKKTKELLLAEQGLPQHNEKENTSRCVIRIKLV